jgi:tetratricopeptide (TPR) repeat protein/serine/threonine protein kinase
MIALEDQARSIFLAALDRSPDQWPPFVDEACGGNAELRARLEQLLHAHRASGSIHGGPAVVMATLDEPLSERPGTVIGHYKLLEQIGEGGFGVVFMAEQQQPIRRKVALKVLKPGMDTRQVVARFEAERQALALMDHPNIARVFDGGETILGRPYFVMELVKGIPITDYCDQGQLATRERLELFLHVCQAIQHAHQKGIIHRDLKPSNVLVTMHDGTPVVKVIDFGIAKATGQQLTEKTLFTNFAQLVGTPLYMSPDQAALSGLDVDTRSDIYSLGVLLYELLTGTTPFDKERFRTAGYDEIRRVIREEEPPKPSTRISTLGQAATLVSAQRQSDPKRLSQIFRGELDWIVMKCLEKDRNRRYETASALAGDVQRYLRDEPVLACPPSAWYRLRKFGRRNKQALAMAGAALFLIVLLGAVVGWAVRDTVARQALLEQDTVGALLEVEKASERDKLPDALAALKRAEGLLGAGGSPELRRRVREWRTNLDLVVRLREATMRGFQVNVTESRFRRELAIPGYEAALRDCGIHRESMPAERAAEWVLGRPAEIRLALIAALDSWSDHDALGNGAGGRAAERKWLQAVLQIADTDPWRTRMRQAARGGDVKTVVALARPPELTRQPPYTLAGLGSVLCSKRVGRHDLGIAVLLRAQQMHPDDFMINLTLGTALSSAKPRQRTDALRFFSIAVALQPDNAGAHLFQGHALYRRSKLDEAVAAVQKAIAMKPDYVEALLMLGAVLREQGKLGEAVAACRKAIALKPDYGSAHSHLAAALTNQGKWDEAVAEGREGVKLAAGSADAYIALGHVLRRRGQLDEAIALDRKAITLDPDTAWGYAELGHSLMDQGKLEEAAAEQRKAIELDPEWALPHSFLAQTLAQQHKLDEAILECRKAITLEPDDALGYKALGYTLGYQHKLEEATRAYRKAVALRPEDSEGLSNLALILTRQGKLDEAISLCRQSIALDPGCALAYRTLGSALQEQDKLDEAVAAFRQSITLEPEAAVKGSREVRHFLAGAYANLGGALVEQEKLDEAVAQCRKALELNPDSAPAHNNLGNAFLSQGKLDQATAAFRRAIALAPDWAPSHLNVGTVYYRQGKLEPAIAESQKAIELDPTCAPAHAGLGNAYLDQGKIDQAIAAYRKAIALKPSYALAHNNFGNALKEKGKLAEAIAEYRKAIDLNPSYAKAFVNLGIVLSLQGKPAEGLVAYREAVRVQPDYAIGWCSLGTALEEQGMLEDAVAALSKAIAIQPEYLEAHHNLGNAFLQQGKFDQAAAQCRKVLALKPGWALTHHALGLALRGQGKLEEAIAQFRTAIRLKPDHADAHNSLGSALSLQGKMEEALSALRQAISLKPDLFNAHANLASALYQMRDLQGAIAASRKAVALKPGDAAIYLVLGQALRDNGEFAEALIALKHGHELGSRNPRWPYPSAKLVRECEKLVTLDARLSRVLAGKEAVADARERLAFADLCYLKRRFERSARFYEEALSQEPGLAEDFQHNRRYNAACTAALAGCGQGADAATLEHKTRARLRRQALDWLRADLAAWAQLLEKPTQVGAVQQTLRHWQQEPELAGVRGGGLTKLPEEERQPWQQLWADVEQTLTRASHKGTKDANASK